MKQRLYIIYQLTRAFSLLLALAVLSPNAAIEVIEDLEEWIRSEKP